MRHTEKTKKNVTVSQRRFLQHSTKFLSCAHNLVGFRGFDFSHICILSPHFVSFTYMFNVIQLQTDVVQLKHFIFIFAIRLSFSRALSLLHVCVFVVFTSLLYCFDIVSVIIIYNNVYCVCIYFSRHIRLFCI